MATENTSKEDARRHRRVPTDRHALGDLHYDESNNSHNSNSNQRQIDIEMTEKWSAFYPNEKIAVVTSESRPPLPPDGTRT